jgi:hypothetical protein
LFDSKIKVLKHGGVALFLRLLPFRVTLAQLRQKAYNRWSLKEDAMRTLFLITTAALLVLPAASSARRDMLTEDAKLAKRLDGYSPGKSVSCIDLRDAQGTEAIGDALIFQVSHRLFYKSDTRGGCGQRWHGDTFVTRTFGARLCRGDVVSRADLTSGFETGFCIAGDFTPYRRQN